MNGDCFVFTGRAQGQTFARCIKMCIDEGDPLLFDIKQAQVYIWDWDKNYWKRIDLKNPLNPIFSIGGEDLTSTKIRTRLFFEKLKEIYDSLERHRKGRKCLGRILFF